MRQIGLFCGIFVIPALSASAALPVEKSWSYAHAAHLLRRAGFGGSPRQIQFLTDLGRDKAVDYLLDYEKIEVEPIALKVTEHREPLRMMAPDAEDEELKMLRQQRDQADRLQMSQVTQWWIQTMVSTPRPLQEKMVLFWHGHFTSGYREVKSSRALYLQNQTFRGHATGNFRDLLIEVTKDPAMILYLNTQQNVKRKPNENYARELMELFTLGTGRYSEQDIKEAARAFTGIKIDRQTGEPQYLDRQHDYGPKTFLGRKGNFGPVDIIDIILAQPAAPEHLATKLWTYFAYDNPENRVIKSLAGTIRKNKYALKPVLREIFRSAAFYGDRAMFTHIKSPVELIVGTFRALGSPLYDTISATEALRAMGQELFQPPNVKGWDGGAAWITTSTLYNRYNMLSAAFFGTDGREQQRQRRQMQRFLQETFGKEATMAAAQPTAHPQPAYDPRPELKAQSLTTPDAIVDYYIQCLLQRPLDEGRRILLIETLKGRMEDDDPTSGANIEAIRGLLHLIVSMPEYQLS